MTLKFRLKIVDIREIQCLQHSKMKHRVITDGYSGYNVLTDVQRCQCWAHVRRGFADCLKSKSPGERANTLAERGLYFCNPLFDLERKYKDLTPDDRKKARDERTRPVLAAFWTFVNESLATVLPKSRVGEALLHAFNRKADLETFLEDGHCAISNNPAENSIRPFTVGRKNWEFAGSPKGADASACVYSLIETAKVNGIVSTQRLLDAYTLLRLCFGWAGCEFDCEPQFAEASQLVGGNLVVRDQGRDLLQVAGQDEVLLADFT